MTVKASIIYLGLILSKALLNEINLIEFILGFGNRIYINSLNRKAKLFLRFGLILI